MRTYSAYPRVLTHAACARVGCAGAHERDDARAILHGHAHQDAATNHARRERRDGKDRPHQRQAQLAGRRLPHRQRAVQLLHDLRYASEDPRKAAREEGGEELWSPGQQTAHLLRRRYEHARGLIVVNAIYRVKKFFYRLIDKKFTISSFVDYKIICSHKK